MRDCITRLLLALLLLALAASAQTITAVQDGAAYTNDLAQGSVFVVKGTNLSAAGYVAATAPTYPTTAGLNNVRITLTAVSGGTVVNAYMVYTYNQGGLNQLAAVVPSNTPPGAYDLRVINNANTSAAFRTNVVARKPGIVTADSSGAGLAQATIGGDFGALIRPSNSGKIGSYNTRPANPGERIDFWGTGLGPDLASDTGSFSGDLTGAASIRVILNGTEITPAYAGRSPGYPGLDEIVVVLPSNVTLGCSVSVQIRSGGVLSNQVAISTAAPGASSCLVLPSGVWRCAVGVSPFFTYYDMTVNGLDYVLKTAAGSPTGQYQAGTNRTIFGGTPVSFVTGGFGGFVGEYLPKGTPDINRIPTIEHRLWLRPPDAGSYSVICSLP